MTIRTVFLTLYVHLETLLALHSAATQVRGGKRKVKGLGQLTTFRGVFVPRMRGNAVCLPPPHPPADGLQLCSGLSVGGALVDAGFWALDCMAGSLLLALVGGGGRGGREGRGGQGLCCLHW